MLVEEKISKIFFDSFGRIKITPRHESAIQVMLEDEFSLSQVKAGLARLEHNGFLGSEKIVENESIIAKFYFPKKFENNEKIKEKINRSVYWIRRYSDVNVIKMIGDHLHDVVKSELRAQNFRILDEKNVKEYNGKKWNGSESLDIIAAHKEKSHLVVGVEIKNSLYPPPKSEVITKIEMCKFFGIIPIFACRWIEIYRNMITEQGGFLWQFKNQLYPRGQEMFVETIRKRFKFPVSVSSILPINSVADIEKWISTF